MDQEEEDSSEEASNDIRGRRRGKLAEGKAHLRETIISRKLYVVVKTTVSMTFEIYSFVWFCQLWRWQSNRQGTEEGAANGCSFAEKTGILYRFEMKLIWGLWDCNILQCFFALGKMLFGTIPAFHGWRPLSTTLLCWTGGERECARTCENLRKNLSQSSHSLWYGVLEVGSPPTSLAPWKREAPSMFVC